MGQFKDKVIKMGENEIREKIGGLGSFAELSVKELAKEDGYADTLARGWRNSLKATQLRKFFDAVKGIERRMEEGGNWSDVEADFYLLQPQVAYAQARTVIPRGFHDIVKICMSKVDVGDEKQKRQNYERFVQFLEAIVAYHKYYNPRGGL